MKPLFLLFLFALPVFAQPEIKYDKFNDSTSVTGHWARLDHSLYMDAMLKHAGATPKDEVVYYLAFRSASKGWRFLNQRELIFLVDGERLFLGEGSHSGDAKGGLRSVYVSERMVYTISRSNLEKIANGTTVELKLGSIEGKLSDKDRKGIKEILGYAGKN